MPIFRKKPVEIEAVQLPKDTFSSDVIVATEAKLAFEEVLKVFTEGEYVNWRWQGGDFKGIVIPTLEGKHLASPGDWIIKGIAGEFYPCKPDIFSNSYEEVLPKKEDSPFDKMKKDFLFRVKHNRALRVSDRSEDRVRQSCRRDGYAEVVMNPRRWVITKEGEDYLNG